MLICFLFPLTLSSPPGLFVLTGLYFFVVVLLLLSERTDKISVQLDIFSVKLQNLVFTSVPQVSSFCEEE